MTGLRIFDRTGRPGLLALFSLFALTGTQPALATDNPTPSIELELNSFSKAKEGCLVNFVMRNRLASAIQALSLELVLFNKEGKISRVLAVNAGELPLAKTRVKQYLLNDCEAIGRILINDITTCTGRDLTPRTCLKALKTRNRTSIEFGQ